MAKGKKEKRIALTDFKTWNLNHPSLIPNDHWADAQNMVRGSDGLWENRKGITSFDNAVGSGKKVHSIHFWQPADASSRFLTVGSGTALYSYAEGTEYNNGTFTSRQTGFTDAAKFSFAQYNDSLLATNGEEAMYDTPDNTVWTIRNGANTRIAKHIHFANDIGYCTDVAGARSVVYYSGAVPANAYEFPNSVEIEADNGQINTGLTNLGPIIVVPKTRSMYSLDVATPARDQLDYSEGTVSNRSIVRAENSIYLATKEGVFTLAQRQGTTGSLAATPISDEISELWAQLINHEDISGHYFPKQRSIVYSVETADKKYTLVYNIRHQSWSYIIGANALDWSQYTDDTGLEHLIYADAYIDRIRELFADDRSDDGADIISVLQTGSLNFGTDDLKTCKWLELSGYASPLFELTVELFYDESEIAAKTFTIDKDNFTAGSSGIGSGSLASGALASGALAGSVTSGSDLDVDYWVKRTPLEKTFRTVTVKITNAQAGVRWRFKSATFNIYVEANDLTPNYIFN